MSEREAVERIIRKRVMYPDERARILRYLAALTRPVTDEMVERGGFGLYFMSGKLSRRSDARRNWDQLPLRGREPHYPNKQIWYDRARAVLEAALGVQSE